MGQHNITPSLDFERDPSFDNIKFSSRELKAPKVKVDTSYNPFENRSVKKQIKSENWEALFENIPSLQSQPKQLIIEKEWEEDYKDHFPSNGHINFSYGVNNLYGCASMLIKPRVGDFFVFPNYLFHCVYPFYTDGERRSFSMNMTFEKKEI